MKAPHLIDWTDDRSVVTAMVPDAGLPSLKVR